MEYRGEDHSRGPADSRRQQPWQSYGQDAGHAPADGPENNGQGWQQEYGDTGGYPDAGGYAQSGGYPQASGYGNSGFQTDGEYPRGFRHPGNGEGYGQHEAYGRSGGYGQLDGPQPDHGQPDYGQPGYAQPDYAQGDQGPGQPRGLGGYGDNDWYGGGSGSGFADTSMDLPALPDRGAPRGDQPPRPAARAALPPALPAAPPAPTGPIGGLGQTRQQDALGDPRHVTYPGYDGVEDEGGFAGSGGYAAQQGYDDYDDYAAHGYDEPGGFGGNPGLDGGPGYGNTGYENTGYGNTRQDNNTAVIDEYADGFGSQETYGQDAYNQEVLGQEAYGQDALGQDDYVQDDYVQDSFGEDDAPGPGGRPGTADVSSTGGGSSTGGRSGRNSRNGAGPRPRTQPKSRKSRARRRILVSSVALVCLVAAVGAVYMLILKPKNSASTVASPNAPLPSSGSSSGAAALSACQKEYGTFCHIEYRTDDPTPLTTKEVFPPIFLNKADDLSFQRLATRTDTSDYCASAVFGSDLITQLQDGDCTQFLRATYVVGTGKNQIVGTIGVANLKTTNDAHHAGRVVGTNDFIAPVTTSNGPGKNIGEGNGLSKSTYKGHYLVLIWAQFADSTSPTSLTSAQQTELSQFESDLMADTVNIALSDRMVTGKPVAEGL
ncbi:MAG TPA: hypothetical protein VG142_04060 [Trebonia sp.]|jgi:hypothetical protein|nr:hypothetical protein [Trebonia sp.]